MEGPKIADYVQRFHDLSTVVPCLVEPEFKRIERFIWGLVPQILSMVTTSKPPTITDAIDLSVALTKEAVRLGKFSISEKKKETHVESSGENRRKFTNFKKDTQETCWHGTGRGNGGHDGIENRGGNNDNDNNNYQGGNGDDQGRGQGCFNCSDVGHFRKYCPNNKQARGRVFNIGPREARQDPNVVIALYL
ncbi:uncharacterized protein LOC110882215 [Helianthus annuus]|uniref:uncharacterized protein LOC110882215 n=1 Tax=Helianthus annuus TaxID=4232 RepID=UPI000B901DC9|nr:uncharacterized protein LOC110882215 [Helianthus annuus]